MSDGDERLMAALIGWYWFDDVEGEPDAIGPPTPEAFEEVRSLIPYLDARGFRIVATDNATTEQP